MGQVFVKANTCNPLISEYLELPLPSFKLEVSIINLKGI